MSGLYRAYSAAVPTTAAMAATTTGTAIKTHLQITAPATRTLTIVKWGYLFETNPTVFVKVELINTTTVAGTGMTAVTPTVLDGGPASLATAGFHPSAEGTVVATTEVLDVGPQLSTYYQWEWSLGREPVLAVSNVLRVRMTTNPAVNALCWIEWTE